MPVRALVESDTRFSEPVKKRLIERVTQEVLEKRDGSTGWTRYLLAELVARGRAQDAVRSLLAAVRYGVPSLDAIPLELQICRWLHSARYSFFGTLGVELTAELELSLELLAECEAGWLPHRGSTRPKTVTRFGARLIRNLLAISGERLREVLKSLKADGTVQAAVNTVEAAMKQGLASLTDACASVELLASLDRHELLDKRGLRTYQRALGMLGQLHIVYGGGRYFTQ
jgi:hypothetical protein